MVGGGLRAAKNQFAPKEEGDLLESLTFSHDGISEMPAGYEKYNPEGLQFCNMGGLHLIPSPFMPWSVELFRFIVDSLGFGAFTKVGAKKVGSLRDDVRLKIATNYAGQTRPHFWVVSERKKAERVNKKRKRDLEAASSSNDLESQEIVVGDASAILSSSPARPWLLKLISFPKE